MSSLDLSLSGVITLAYDLHLTIIIPRFEDLHEEAKNRQVNKSRNFPFSPLLQSLLQINYALIKDLLCENTDLLTSSYWNHYLDKSTLHFPGLPECLSNQGFQD